MSRRNSRLRKAERRQQRERELQGAQELAAYFNALAVLLDIQDNPNTPLTEEQVQTLEAAKLPTPPQE